MAKILVLAPSGFGKSISLLPVPELGIEGLPPKDTYIISVTNRPLPYKGSAKLYPVTTSKKIKFGKRIITNSATEIEAILKELLEAPPIKNVVIDDFNYIMQDWYMDNALKTGWDAPKKIGSDIGRLFKVFEKFQDKGKHIIILAHGENVPTSDGRVYTKMKTTGKMVDDYITPEGKFDITLVGKSKFDPAAGKVIKEFVTNEDATHSSPKSPPGMLPDLYMPNDLGKVIKRIDAYYLGELDDEHEVKAEGNGQTNEIINVENLESN